ncbi:Protein SCAI [Eufriesea mexicana]|uniref:Protein SCAI n=1 Tax=Eufriesea mexicana TaxID=516756 RepID=A0A310S9H4_9HYME|nr:Protein SCAI [Eufriesea mexicana]
MVMMAGMDDHERKVVLEFCHLLEKSKQLFNGLRDLPQYGHKQWQGYFGRTFDIYTKLWKFQQQHRAILDTKYGLKRWQIGEIASKIGQLYYHYYLRTSETSYLHEAYSFYVAIRGRAYYSRAAKEDRSDLMVKKLRYYARFIVVCLLLNRMKLVRELVQELDAQIADYTSTYEPDDQLEWNLVLDEIKAFVKAESAVGVVHSDSNPVILTHRLGPQTSPPVERTPPMCLSLQEILIVGNCADQVKFSELSMDMFRMLQTLEREPRDDPNHLHDASPAGRMPFRPGAYPGAENGAPRRDNPHKYLLYKPTYSQVQVFLASGFKELPANGALLLYLSADGCFSTVKHPEERINQANFLSSKILVCILVISFLHNQNFLSISRTKRNTYFSLPDSMTGSSKTTIILKAKANHALSEAEGERVSVFSVMGYDLGGVSTCSKRDPEHGKRPTGGKEPHCLYPGDLYPFTRKPLFVVVDSDNSFVFQQIPRYFGQPLMVLMSPQDTPPTLRDVRHGGSLFTLFLHAPLAAFCLICNIGSLAVHHWERCQRYIERFLIEACQLVTRSRCETSVLQFFGDDFLRLLLVRYVFCDVVLNLHRSFRGRQQRPRCHPPLPDADVLEHPTLHHLVLDLATCLDCRDHFPDSNELA